MTLQFPNTILTGHFDAAVYELGGSAPTTVIDETQSWEARFDWGVHGSPLTKMLAGKWCLSLHLESIGPGPEVLLPVSGPKEVPFDPAISHYTAVITVPAGTIATSADVIYKVVACLTTKDALGRPGPIAGYVEGPILQFFDPGP